MEQQDVFYDGAEYIETVSVGINNLGCFTTARIMHVQIIKVIVWHCFQSGGGEDVLSMKLSFQALHRL